MHKYLYYKCHKFDFILFKKCLIPSELNLSVRIMCKTWQSPGQSAKNGGYIN